MAGIDLSVQIRGVTFRNPIIPGASDIVLDETGTRKCIEQGVGGIVTKTFSSRLLRTRPRPWHFNYRVFGKGLESNWMTRGGWHPLSSEQAAEKLIPGMARLCREEGVPLVVSFANSTDVDEWVTDAKRFEQAGANMLELSFCCPHASQQLRAVLGTLLGDDIPLATEIIRAVKNAVRVPVSPKFSVNHDILFVPRVTGFVEAGADSLTTTNSFTGMLVDIEEEVPFGGLGAGGYQIGRALLPISLSRVVETRKLTDVPLIAVGGVNQAADAIMYLLVGCSLVGVAGAIFKNGFGVFSEIIKGIEEWMGRKGYSSTKDFVGKVHNLATKVSSPDLLTMEWPFPMPQERSSPIIPAVDMDKCILCSRCQDFCLSGVYSVNKAKGLVHIDHENKCWGCGDCVGWCPANAIKLIDRDTKEVVWDNHGLAKPYRPEYWKR